MTILASLLCVACGSGAVDVAGEGNLTNEAALPLEASVLETPAITANTSESIIIGSDAEQISPPPAPLMATSPENPVQTDTLVNNESGPQLGAAAPDETGEDSSSPISIQSPLAMVTSPENPVLTEAPANSSPDLQSSEAVPAETDEGISLSDRISSFLEIEEKGLSNACYFDEDHYEAEFLYQNPDVCFWSTDLTSQTVTALDIPSAPADAIKLPAPSGSDDTAILEQIINQNEGGAVVGNGTYILDGLKINVSIDVFDMPSVPAAGAGNVVVVNAPDVRIFNSPIDGKNSSTAEAGFVANDGAHRFTLVKSGFSNVFHKQSKSVAGVYLRGVDDFHIACNTFDNIINETDDTDATARANAIWMNGGKDESTSGGVIANNIASNHQSNGARDDAEFFTMQSYSHTDPANPVKIYANRATDAGKRFTKHQAGDAKVLSNYHAWEQLNGPLGKRTLLASVEVHNENNVTARNNRVKVGAESRFSRIFISSVISGSARQDNIHYDCNDIEVTDYFDRNGGNSPTVINARVSTVADDATGFEATNSSAINNHIHGNGSVRFHYWFGPGYSDNGGGFDTSGNTFEIDFTDKEYK